MIDKHSDIIRFFPPESSPRLPDEIRQKAGDILDSINSKVAAEETLNRIISFVFESTHDLFPCDRIGLAFLDEDGTRVTAHHAVATYDPLLLKKGYSESLQGSTLKDILHSGNTRIINDLETYLRMKPQSRSTQILIREGVRSSMTCPLTVENRIVGLFFRSSREKHAYSAEQVSMHQAIAQRMSQAVEKAFRIEQLTEANRSYLELLGFVSHELKSPVSSMVLDAKMLTEGYLGDLSEKQALKIRKMITKGEHLLGIIREYLDLARIEGGEMTPNVRDKVDFNMEILRPSVEILEAEIDHKSVNLEMDVPDTPVHVDCDPNLMKIVVVNLISNAVKYGNENGRIAVTLNTEDNRLHLSVWNEGPGFPESQRDRLFKKFSRLNTPELARRKGTGVGLYTVYRIIDLHGGKIRAESKEKEWARFYFDMPLNADS